MEDEAFKKLNDLNDVEKLKHLESKIIQNAAEKQLAENWKTLK